MLVGVCLFKSCGSIFVPLVSDVSEIYKYKSMNSLLHVLLFIFKDKYSFRIFPYLFPVRQYMTMLTELLMTKRRWLMWETECSHPGYEGSFPNCEQ